MTNVFLCGIFFLLAIDLLLRHARRKPKAASPEKVRQPQIVDVLDAIRHEHRALRDYESEHVERQTERIGTQEGVKTLRPHGEYAPDQAREHILIRLRQQFPVLPSNINALLRVEVPDAE